MTHHIVPRDDVVTCLAGMIADSTHWVVSISMHKIPMAARAIATAGGTLWLDRGSANLFEVEGDPVVFAGVAVSVDLATDPGDPVGEMVGVAAVPRSIGSRRVAEMFRQEPDVLDGVDAWLIVFQCDCLPTNPVYFPSLIVDVLAVADPRAAAQMRADDVRNLS